jgi:TRAP-type C4-dicarboxylate transport system substrate-binding protein
MVGDGSLDLALLPTRAIAEAGAERLNVLQAPFLIDSAALASAVARSPIAAELLDDLDSQGMVGLSMLPEGIRRPVGYVDALIAPSDYEGRGIRVPVSRVAYELFTALGALPSISRLYQEGADGEELSAAESGPEWRDSLPAKTVTTADVGFYPKFDVIVGSERLWSELSETQRAVLIEAADRISASVSARRSSDAGEFAAYCGKGGTIALAGPEVRDALSRAAEPVMVRLAADPERAELLKSLSALKDETAVPPFEAPPECRPGGADGQLEP